MKFAAIDIGSNAIRFQLTGILKYEGQVSFKKIEYIRFPLRLGHDTFTKNEIGAENIEKFIKLLHAFKLLIELYDVTDYMICATSAMREAANGSYIVSLIKEKLGMDIQVIDGDMEAGLISNSIKYLIDHKKYLHIDVGGGSTELNFYNKGSLVSTQSFKLGSVRRLEHFDTPEQWEMLRLWIEENIKPYSSEIIAIGTGGNIGKLNELAGKKNGKSITYNELVKVQKYVGSKTMDERIYLLKLNPDRADVIIPASEIYLAVMNWANATEILVPDAGLKDGIIQSLFEKHKHKLQD